MVFQDPDVRTDELPRSMDPQPGRGDVEEGTAKMMNCAEIDFDLPDFTRIDEKFKL